MRELQDTNTEDIERAFAEWYSEHTAKFPRLLSMPGSDEIKMHLLMAFGKGVFAGAAYGAAELERRLTA